MKYFIEFLKGVGIIAICLSLLFLLTTYYPRIMDLPSVALLIQIISTLIGFGIVYFKKLPKYWYFPALFLGVLLAPFLMGASSLNVRSEEPL